MKHTMKSMRITVSLNDSERAVLARYVRELNEVASDKTLPLTTNDVAAFMFKTGIDVIRRRHTECDKYRGTH